MTPAELKEFRNIYYTNYDMVRDVMPTVPMTDRIEFAGLCSVIDVLRRDLKEMENRETTRRLHEKYFGQRRIG